MSENVKIKIKINKTKHIKGKYSMPNPPNPNCLLSNNNNNNLYTKSKEPNRTKANSKTKKSVKQRNNRSFILKPKNKKDNNDLNIKILTHRSISKNPNPDKYKSNINLKNERKNPFHARIKSFKINYDKNNLYKNSKTERNYSKEKNIINNFNIKKNKNKFDDYNNRNLNHNHNENLTSKKAMINKTNNYLDDIEDSTKNTKIMEQKLLNLDNFNNDNNDNDNNNDNKLLILQNNKNNQKIEINKIEKKINIYHGNKNSVLINSKKNKLKNNFSLNIQKNDLNNSKKEEKDKKNISNMVQKIKDKIHSIQTTMEDNYNTARNTSNIDISFITNKKLINKENNPSQKIAKHRNIQKNKNLNQSLKLKSPININQKNRNILNNSNNQDIHSDISIKNKKIFTKNKIKNFNKTNRNKKKLFNNNNSLYNSNETFNQKENKHFNGNKSQNDIFSDFVEKTLNNIDEKKNSPIKNKKNPKDFSEKNISKIDSLCEKGYVGRNIEKKNQDNFFIYKNFMNNDNYIFMGVCDGHGILGHEVSGYLVYNIPLTLNDKLIKKNYSNITKENNNDIKKILKNTFIQIDKNISTETEIDATFSGSTCISLIYTPTKLFCANVGDSRCIIGKYDEKQWFSKDLSIDHKPDVKLEKERILKNGGKIEPYLDENNEYYGPERVWLKDGNVPGLAMSRSFGDIVAHSVGVICEPEIMEYLFLEEDKFIILASDGIWEFISSNECVDIVKDYYIDKDINGAINFLFREASKRWIIKEEVVDDITLIIIFLE